MNTQQKLADIYMLATYIKEHVDTRPVHSDSNRLDEIGNVTLKIAEMLGKIETQTGDGIDNLLKDYKVDISKAADSIMTQLLKVKEVLDKNTGLTSELYEKIETIYVEYTAILEQSTKKLELQRENFAKEVENLNAEVSALTEAAKSLNEKTLTEEQISSLVGGLEQQLGEIVAQDKNLNEIYLQNADRLEDMVKGIQTSYENLNEMLASVDGSFKTAVSRLEILSMQMNLLTGEGRN